jgi:uncharacterized protein (TIGR02246 family)
MTQVTDEAAIRHLIDAFTEGWNAHDGKACARPFAADADFTNIMGLKAHGRDMIARGHDEILSTVFREARISSTVHSIRFIRPDVAVADVTFKMQSEGGGPFGLRQSQAGLVATKDNNVWSIVVFRNMVPFERPTAGPMEWALALGTGSA